MIKLWAVIVTLVALAACSDSGDRENAAQSIEPTEVSEAAKPAAFSCEPEQEVSFDILLENHRAILVGELHGTIEMPAAFGDMVEAAANSGKRIAVALEFDRRWQTDIDAVIAAPDQASAEAVFSKRATFDGRTSAAMRNLLYRLRNLKQSGADIDVFAIDFWQRAEESQPYSLPDWLPEKVDVKGALRDIRQGEKSVADCLSINCEHLMFFAGNLHTRPVISESFYFDSETGEETPFTTAPAGAIIAHEMTTAAIYLTHSGGSIKVNTGGGLKVHQWKASAPGFIEKDKAFYCAPEGSMHHHVYDVGPITASSDPTQQPSDK